MKTWLKAGLIGGLVGSVLTLPVLLTFYLPIGLGAVITSCLSIVFLLLYPGVGVLAAFWLPKPRTTKQGAMDGALAGFVAFTIDGIATVLITLIATWTGGLERYVLQLIPDFRPDMLDSVATLSIALIAGFSCVNILVGVMFSALGGFVFASMKPE